MPYALRSGVSYTIIGSQFVFLDTSADRYFVLSGAVAAAFQRLRHDGLIGRRDRAAAKLLIDCGLIVPAADESISPIIIAVDGGRSDSRRRPPAWRTVLIACYGILQTRRCLRVHPFHNVLAHFSRSSETRRIGKTHGVDGFEDIVAAFEVAKMLLPSRDRCLSHSLALGQRLRRRGIDCDVVFGVATKPFSAHCWVQRKGCVLNDDVEHVRTFSPILLL